MEAEISCKFARDLHWRIYRAIGLSVEDGTRLHILLGYGGLLGARGGSALAGLAALRHITERTSVSDQLCGLLQAILP